MTNRNFDEWLSRFRPSISSYDYYIDFEKVVRNVDEIKVELNILNSLISSKNIEEAFEYIKAQPDVTLINTTEDYKVYQISKTEPSDFYYFDEAKEKDAEGKQKAADILGNTKYFYFIDKYGLQWEFEQGHTDIGD